MNENADIGFGPPYEDKNNDISILYDAALRHKWQEKKENKKIGWRIRRSLTEPP